ncbi:MULTISPECIES: formimidoylglutamate deiminase [unclassified Roseateles]|uniref:formimidoylglutamate deiminase n=1 Tax=unclassified Roseateles TaxID=2626991 RepID=UPI0006F63939|nr:MULTISPECIES: formimidoylglutamate deiminase [unclassified Roseateles]KQW41943.1 N-formylglutamate amidohydrolase [Pelomonas sp. Root405]KRA67546.1 N-formylglutamate amidohydrolase [Pelomonas sp. Root662]
MSSLKKLHAPLAWIDGRWQRDVLLCIDASGHWSEITINLPAPADAERLIGPVIPSLVNAHSHAFQRAFVGLAERREAGHDDFWSWRDRMYALALRISPQQLHAVASQLYAEMLRGGYTQVCEFHYLHHPADGQEFEDEMDMAWALATAAEDVGIGLTLLPVVYTRSGFAADGLRPDQHRFAADADWAWRASQRVMAAGLPRVNAGVALHSLRGASPQDITRLLSLVGAADLPIHIHVAEQTAEVADCLKATGMRPLQWLAEAGHLDPRWQLVHATHAELAEIEAVARSGAGIVICPGTEANLGDGLADLPRWLQAGVPLTVGSDSQVTRGWVEELRWLEYGQRLALRQRNVAAAPGSQPSSAARLFDAAVAGGARAAGFSAWGLTPGARADALVLNRDADALRGLPDEALLDAVVFGSNGSPWQSVWVAGRARPWRAPQRVGDAFEAAMHELWSPAPTLGA